MRFTMILTRVFETCASVCVIHPCLSIRRHSSHGLHENQCSASMELASTKEVLFELISPLKFEVNPYEEDCFCSLLLLAIRNVTTTSY